MSTLLQLWREVCGRSPALVNQEGKHLIVGEADLLLLGSEIERTMLSAAPTPAAQSAGQEPVYQTQRIMGGWDDVTQAEFARTHESRRRIVYTKAVSAPELVAHVRKLVNGEILDSTGCLTRWEDLPDGTPIYANAAPVNGGERELGQVIDERDQYHDAAEKLADAIAKHFGVEIGEHSNLNCPWQNALDHIAQATKRAADAQHVDANIRGEVAYQLHTRNRWLDMPTMRAIVDSAFDAAIAKNALTSPAKVGGDKRVLPPLPEPLGATGYFSSAQMREYARTALSADGGECHKESQAGPLLCKAAGELPEGWQIVVEVENGYGGVNLIAPDGMETDFSGRDMLLSEQISAAIDAAKAKGEA